MNVKTATSRHLPRIGGCFACALDGCFGSHDAALNAPYADETGGEGVLYYDDQKSWISAKKPTGRDCRSSCTPSAIRHLTRPAAQ